MFLRTDCKDTNFSLFAKENIFFYLGLDWSSVTPPYQTR